MVETSEALIVHEYACSCALALSKSCKNTPCQPSIAAASTTYYALSWCKIRRCYSTSISIARDVPMRSLI